MKKSIRGLFILTILSLTLTSCDLIRFSTGDNSSSSVTTTSDDITTTTSEDPNNGGGSTTETNDVSVRSVLSQLQETPFAYSGYMSATMVEQSTQEVVYYEDAYYEGYLSEDTYISITKDASGNEISHVEYFKDPDNGAIITKKLNPITNEVESSRYGSSRFSSRYYNPYNYVDISMGTLTDDSVVFDLDMDAAFEIFDFFFGNSGYPGAGTLTVYIDTTSGDIQSVCFKTDTFSEDTYNYWVEFTYSYISYDDIDTYWTEPIEDDGTTSDLSDMFIELAKGNYSAEITIVDLYSDENFYYVILKMTDDMIIIDDFTNLYGYANVENGYQSFYGTSGETQLISNSSTKVGSVSDLQTPFSIKSYMFEKISDIGYRYANRGTEEYLIYTMPEYLYVSQIIDLEGSRIDENSYIWRLNQYGNIDIEYMIDNYHISTHIYNIGNTDVSEYTFNKQEAPTSWDDVDGATELLLEYGIDGQLPFFSDLGVDWFVLDNQLIAYVSVDIGYSVPNYLNGVLEDAGWYQYDYVLDYYETMYFRYDIDDQTSLSIIVGVGYNLVDYIEICITICSPINSGDNNDDNTGDDVEYDGINAWLYNNFSDPNNMNYTLNEEYTQIILPADYDETTYTINGYYYDNMVVNSGTLLSQIDGNIGYEELIYNTFYGEDSYKSQIADEYYYEDYYYYYSNNEVNSYTRTSINGGEYSSWTLDTVHSGVNSIADVSYTPYDLLGESFYLRSENNSSYEYYITNDNVSIASKLLCIAGFPSWSNSYYLQGQTITYNDNDGSLYVYLYIYNYYYVDEATFGSNVALIENIIEFSIYNVGDTIITVPEGLPY